MSNHTTEHLDTDDQRAFRLKAREYMAGRLPPRLPDEPALDWESDALVLKDKAIQRMLWDGGFAGITVAKAYGGQGLDRRYEDVFHEEAEPYRLPWSFGNAFNVVLKSLLGHASEALKVRYVTGMLRGDEVWCQLLSEPSGGSDLAGVLTRAEKRGDKWVLNGSKVWTTGGHHCDMGLCLARTDPTLPKHAGLSVFLVNMRSPGMTITPLKLIDGGTDFCQEFMDDLEVPLDHIVGEVNGGWAVIRTHLEAEHSAMARGWHIGIRMSAQAETLEPPKGLVDMFRSLGRQDDPRARQLAGEAFMLDVVQSLTTQRVGRGIIAGTLHHTAGSIPSLMAARTGARRSAVLSELTGPVGVAAPLGGDGPRWGLSRVMTHRIGGGTQETQLNNVAERVLDLPREPGPARETPFNQLRTNAPRQS